MAASDEGGPRPGSETPPPGDTGPSRAEQRIQQLLGKLSEAEQRIKVLSAGEVERERDTWKSKATTYEQKLAAMKQQHEQAAAGWGRERAFLRRGLVDDEAQAVALALYNRMPEQERPDLGAWMDSWKATGEDGEVVDNTPAAIRAYLQPAAPTEAPPAPAGRPPIPGRTVTSSPATEAEKERVMARLRRNPADPEVQRQYRELFGG